MKILPILKLGTRGSDVAELQRRLNLISDGIFGPLTEETVRAFQRDAGLTVDGIVGPRTRLALGFDGPPRKITEIILHCTATPEGRYVSLEEVRRWHVEGNGWADIGYHYLILLDGTVMEGRDLYRIGAHCTGHNANSIGIAYVGGCASDGKTPKDTRTPAQTEALHDLVAHLQQRFPDATVHCHNEFANKACPSFKMKDF